MKTWQSDMNKINKRFLVHFDLILTVLNFFAKMTVQEKHFGELFPVKSDSRIIAQV